MSRLDGATPWRVGPQILGCKVMDLEEVVDGKKLGSYIEEHTRDTGQEYGSIEKLQELLREEVSAIEWLNRICDFLKNHRLDDVLRECSIIPSQDGFLDKLPRLYRDQAIAEELKDIAGKLLGWNIRQELRDTRLTGLGDEVGAGDRDTGYVSTELIRKLRDRSQANPDADFEQASIRLFSWIVEQENWGLATRFSSFLRGVRHWHSGNHKAGERV